MNEMYLTITEKAGEVLFEKIFGNSVVKHSLLYYRRVHQAKKITLYSPDRFISKLEQIVINDSDLKGLDVEIRKIGKENHPSTPVNRIYYQSNRYLDIFSEKDIQLLRSLLRESIITSCKTPVAKYINKKISLPISSLLAKWNVSPNLITVVGLLFGFIGAILLLNGVFALAFVSFQINSILDGSDGEVAKFNLKWSDVGKKLDVYGDYLTSFLIVAGEAYGFYLVESSEWVFHTSLINILLLALIGCFWIFSIIFRYIPKEFDDVESICHENLSRSKNIYDIPFKVFLYVSRRDFYIFVLFICSLIGLHSFNHLFIGFVCLSWLGLSIYTFSILKRDLSASARKSSPLVGE